ncbi:hypothetical protein HMPREF0322_00118 [Desulfitobacterium hafniense DP7]|uniref:Uncharacterized protein n=1 Tax=Desulfitobacterium hafniense DP7 TaxID=537010 RepID=G9XGQ3_DESHA|nr:hypothetical protein HMPREF0322_00118 [Desulfitobacterium hafniense DP7]
MLTKSLNMARGMKLLLQNKEENRIKPRSLPGPLPDEYRVFVNQAYKPFR